MSILLVRRRFLYLLGFAVLLLSTALYTVGLVAPYWIRGPKEPPGHGMVQFRGIWFKCDTNRWCRSELTGPDEDWLMVVRILQLSGLLGLVLACLSAFVINCRVKESSNSRCLVLECTICLGSLIGFSGAMVFLGKTRHDMENSNGSASYAWAFGLNIASSAAAILSAIFIFVANRCLPHDPSVVAEFKHDPLMFQWDETGFNMQSGAEPMESQFQNGRPLLEVPLPRPPPAHNWDAYNIYSSESSANFRELPSRPEYYTSPRSPSHQGRYYGDIGDVDFYTPEHSSWRGHSPQCEDNLGYVENDEKSVPVYVMPPWPAFTIPRVVLREYQEGLSYPDYSLW